MNGSPEAMLGGVPSVTSSQYMPAINGIQQVYSLHPKILFVEGLTAVNNI